MSASSESIPYVVTRRVTRGRTLGQVRIIGAGHHGAVEWHLVGKVHERLLQVGEPAVTLEMLAIDIRNHRQCRKQLEKRTIAFVRFGHHQLAAAEPRVAAKGAQPSANRRRGIESRPLQHERDHRCRRRLAVRARDGDGVTEPHQLRQHLRARYDRDLPARRFDDFRVPVPHRRRDDHDVRAAHVSGGVTVGDLDADGRQPLRHRRSFFVRPGDDEPEIREQFGDAAHPDAADADEVNASRLA